MLRGGATDWPGELGALINLAQLRGYYVRAAADGIIRGRDYSKSRRSSPAGACALAPRRRCIDGYGRSRSESRGQRDNPIVITGAFKGLSARRYPHEARSADGFLFPNEPGVPRRRGTLLV